jgi:hypothetical protein
MTGVMRFLFALMLGVALGFGAAVYVIQSDAGNVLVRRTDVVQDLERRLQGMEQQRDALGRQLEDVVARAGRMEQAFGELERRFRALDAERPPAAPPPAAAPAPVP